MSGNEFAILTQSAFIEGFKEGEIYILKKIKAELDKHGYYNKCDRVMVDQIINKHIKEIEK